MGADSGNVPGIGELEALWEELSAVVPFPEEEKTREMFLLMMEALKLFSKKQHDYTSINIALGGEEGILVRVTDKWARLFSHYRLGKDLVNESVEDSWLDMAVYALIALLVRRGKWTLTDKERAALGIGE